MNIVYIKVFGYRMLPQTCLDILWNVELTHSISFQNEKNSEFWNTSGLRSFREGIVHLKDTFSGYRILGCHFFLFWHFKCCHNIVLWPAFFLMRILLSFLSLFLYMWCILFSLTAFKIFFSSLVFSYLIIMYPGLA